MPSNAVYDFLGYTLTEAKYVNNYKKDNSYISIEIIGENFSQENKQYSMAIRVASDFDEVESYFVFQAGFMVNDIEWFNDLEKNAQKSIFFSAVFPFIREKLFAITSNTNLGLLIPVIDMRGVDLEKELRLVKASSK